MLHARHLRVLGGARKLGNLTSQDLIRQAENSLHGTSVAYPYGDTKGHSIIYAWYFPAYRICPRNCCGSLQRFAETVIFPCMLVVAYRMHSCRVLLEATVFVVLGGSLRSFLRGGRGTVDWDAVASNCSTGNCLSNFNKRTSSKSSNRQIWARRGFPTVSSPLPRCRAGYKKCLLLV